MNSQEEIEQYRREQSFALASFVIEAIRFVALCGSFKVRFPDGRPSRYFYWDDIAGRRLRSDLADSGTAKRDARTFARAQQDELDSEELGLAWRQRRVHTSNRSAPFSYRGIGSGRHFDLRQAEANWGALTCALRARTTKSPTRGAWGAVAGRATVGEASPSPTLPLTACNPVFSCQHARSSEQSRISFGLALCARLRISTVASAACLP